jgi:hypothetical protein
MVFHLSVLIEQASRSEAREASLSQFSISAFYFKVLHFCEARNYVRGAAGLMIGGRARCRRCAGCRGIFPAELGDRAFLCVHAVGRWRGWRGWRGRNGWSGWSGWSG